MTQERFSKLAMTYNIERHNNVGDIILNVFVTQKIAFIWCNISRENS